MQVFLQSIKNLLKTLLFKKQPIFPQVPKHPKPTKFPNALASSDLNRHDKGVWLRKFICKYANCVDARLKLTR